MALDFTPRREEEPWWRVAAMRPHKASRPDAVIGGWGSEIVAGTQETRELKLGPLAGTIRSGQLSHGPCRAHFAQARDEGNDRVLEVRACTKDRGGDPLVLQHLGAIRVAGSEGPGVPPPEGARRVGFGPYVVPVPHGYRLTHASADNAAGEHVRVDLVQRACFRPPASTWDESFRGEREEFWKVETRSSKRAGRTVLWAHLEHVPPSDRPSKGVRQRACIRANDVHSLHIELSAVLDTSTVNFHTLVDATIALALPR